MSDAKLKVHLKELLADYSMSIRELSIRIDYRFESVRKLYNGTAKQINVDLIAKVCEELDCEVGDLFSVDK